MTILLTAATGFLGSHLLEALLNCGYEIVILKRSFSDTWRITHLLDRVKAYDVDKVPVAKIMQQNTVSIVVHVCGYSHSSSPQRARHSADNRKKETSGASDRIR